MSTSFRTASLVSGEVSVDLERGVTRAHIKNVVLLFYGKAVGFVVLLPRRQLRAISGQLRGRCNLHAGVEPKVRPP